MPGGALSLRRILTPVVPLLALLTTVQPAAAQTHPFVIDDPVPLGTGVMQVGAAVGYSTSVTYPLSGLRGNLWQVPVIGIDVGIGPIADLEISGGPYNRLAITSRRAAPLAGLVRTTDEATDDVEDIVMGTKIRVMAEDRWRPAVGFRFAVRLPNAKHQSGLGQDTTDFSASVLAAKMAGHLRVVSNIGATIMSEPLDAAKQNDVLTYGVSVAATVWPRVALVAEASGRVSVRRGLPPTGTETRGVMSAGLQYTRGRVRLDAALLAGTTGLDPRVGITAGVVYTVRAFQP